MKQVRRKKTRWVGGLAAALVLLISSFVHAAPFTNGSFESASINPGLGRYLFPPSSVITGWQVTSGAIHYSEDFWQYADGNRGLDMNGGSAGAIAQSFDTTPGTMYTVRFSMAGNPDRTTTCCGGAANSPVIKTLRVSAAGVFSDYAFDVTGKTPVNMGWTDKIFSFIAVDPVTILTFQSLTPSPYWGPTLDNVRVMPVATQPPHARFTFSPSAPAPGQVVTFNASASFDDLPGEIVRYHWDFGDGNTAQGRVVTHAYTGIDSFPVTLTVTDDDDLTDSTSQTVHVHQTCQVPGGAQPVAEPISDFGPCGPGSPGEVVLSPKWGRYGVRQVLETDTGEQLELMCKAAVNNWYGLYYTSPQGVRNLVSMSPFEGSCNSGVFYHAGDRDGNGKPDCLIKTVWTSKDYFLNDVPNPWTGAQQEDPPVLDHAISVFDAVNQHLTKIDRQYAYRPGEPPVVLPPPIPNFDFCTERHPLFNPEHVFLRDIFVDPPVGPETEAFFEAVVEILDTLPPGDPMLGGNPPLCDYEGDGDCDKDDLNILLQNRGKLVDKSTCEASCDLNNDGKITALDARKLTLLCTRPRCATQ